jgi:hypothetical protein
MTEPSREQIHDKSKEEQIEECDGRRERDFFRLNRMQGSVLGAVVCRHRLRTWMQRTACVPSRQAAGLGSQQSTSDIHGGLR